MSAANHEASKPTNSVDESGALTYEKPAIERTTKLSKIVASTKTVIVHSGG